MVHNTISKELVEKYFAITHEALTKAEGAFDSSTSERLRMAKDFFDMASRYHSDARYFFDKDDWVLAFAALNYSHGWLDAGARSGLFLVKDSRLFTVDDE